MIEIPFQLYNIWEMLIWFIAIIILIFQYVCIQANFTFYKYFILRKDRLGSPIGKNEIDVYIGEYNNSNIHSIIYFAIILLWICYWFVHTESQVKLGSIAALYLIISSLNILAYRKIKAFILGGNDPYKIIEDNEDKWCYENKENASPYIKKLIEERQQRKQNNE